MEEAIEAAEAEVKTNGAAAPAALDIDAQLDKHIGDALNVYCAGIFGTIRNVPPEKIVLALARNFGRQIGRFNRSGDLIPLMQKRKACNDTFLAAVAEVKMVQPTKALAPKNTVRKAAAAGR